MILVTKKNTVIVKNDLQVLHSDCIKDYMLSGNTLNNNILM